VNRAGCRVSRNAARSVETGLGEALSGAAGAPPATAVAGAVDFAAPPGFRGGIPGAGAGGEDADLASHPRNDPMQEFLTSRSEGPVQGIFSPKELERQMRVEFERAQRHQYPIVCMLIAIDRLAQLADLYGRESKREILRAAIGVLRAGTRDSDLLAPLADDRLLAMFPHTPPDVAAVLARRVLAGARKLRFERDGKTLGISLSIGVAHNQHGDALSFDTLVRVAEEGLAVADAAGGDRFVETELYQLYERRRQMEAEREKRAAAFTGAPRAPASAHDRLLELLSGEGVPTADLKGLDLDTVVRAIGSLPEVGGGGGAGDLEEARRRIDLLERRIAKLVHLLGVTEEELQRIAAMKGIDLGIASIYRSVQGLASDASQRERKLAMMREIFEANIELKRRTPPPEQRPASG
jgi:diguanylate cyclase (GGDEF)-like protein